MSSTLQEEKLFTEHTRICDLLHRIEIYQSHRTCSDEEINKMIDWLHLNLNKSRAIMERVIEILPEEE